MSGGSLEYVYSRINQAVEQIKTELEKLRDERIEQVHPYYLREYPDKPYLASPELLKQEVERRIKEAVKTLERASVLAHAVEWYMSGDTGYESFCTGLDEELEKLDEWHQAEE